jgi:hypothetical protein
MKELVRNLQDALANYYGKRLWKCVESALERFQCGITLDDPSGYYDDHRVFSNFVYRFGGHVEDYNERDYAFWGLVIQRAMEINRNFDAFVREYILRVIEADKDAWEDRHNHLKKYVKSMYRRNSEVSWECVYAMHFNDRQGRYTQSVPFRRFILNEI